MTYERFAHWTTEPVSLEPALSVIVPAYNESARLVPTLVSIAATLTETTEDFEIIVSDDGSTDDTVALVRKLGWRNLIVLDPGVNAGKGAAVRAGVRAAHGRSVLFSDADMSTPMHEVGPLLAELADGADVAIGSRAADGAVEQSKSGLRRLFSSGWRRITRIGLGLEIADTQCGFKMFTRDAARALFDGSRLEGFSFDAEVLFLAARFGYRVAEVPVEWFDAPGSKVQPGRVALQFLRDLVKIRLLALAGKYPDHPCAVSSRPLKLAIVTAVPPSTATLTEYGQHLVHQFAAKPEIGEVVVFADDAAGLPADFEGVSYRAAWTFDSIWSPLRILAQVRRDRPDVVFFNAHFASFGSGKVAAALGLCTPALVRLTGAKSVVLLHNIVDTVDLNEAGYGAGKFMNSVLMRIGRALTRVVLLADTVVTTMPAYVETLRDRYGADNVFLTPHGSFDEPAAPAEEYQGERLTLLAFGKFGTYKRVEDLVEAYRTLVADGHDIDCVIAGTDSPNAAGYLAGVAANNTDLPGLRFTGYVEEADVPLLFTQASIVVFPYSATTGSSGPLHQTGAFARCAVAPRLGDFIDLIETEGFVAEPFEPGDVASLAASISTLLEQPERRRAMGRQNYAAACSLPLAHVADWHISHFEALVA